MKTNSVENKNTFKIALFSTCPIYGKLKIKENKGYLKYYDEKGEITVSFDNFKRVLIIESIINQAEIICLMKHSVLWSY